MSDTGTAGPRWQRLGVRDYHPCGLGGLSGCEWRKLRANPTVRRTADAAPCRCVERHQRSNSN